MRLLEPYTRPKNGGALSPTSAGRTLTPSLTPHALHSLIAESNDLLRQLNGLLTYLIDPIAR
jgi:hypothetical protein